MKKAKLMLAAIMVLAVVGGALAFKVKDQKKYCTTTTEGEYCSFTEGSVILSSTNSSVGTVVSYKYTIIGNLESCTSQTPCQLATTTFKTE